MTVKDALGRFVQPDLTARRLDEQLCVLRERLEGAPSRSRPWIALAALAAVACIAVLWSSRTAPSAPQTTSVETGAEGSRLTLADGSRVVVDAHSVLKIVQRPREVEIALEAGGVDCDVTHDPGRRFSVVAAGFSVRVIGTRFSVRASGRPATGVSVKVSQGRVEVTRGDERALVSAGESFERGWSTESSPKPSAAPVEPPAPVVEPPAPAAPSASPAPDARGTESAKQLFERGTRARAKGRSAEARQAFSALKARYPNDPRAPLAAFELARLEQEEQRGSAQAEKLLGEAIEKAPPGSALREDAEARRVESLSAAGKRDACKAARAQFLAKHPNSVHAKRVLESCAD